MIARLGYLTGLGRTTQEISEDIGGVTRQAVLDARHRMELPVASGRQALPVPVHLSQKERTRLEKRAKVLAISSEEFLRRIAVCVIDDDLYAAVVDGRFD